MAQASSNAFTVTVQPLPPPIPPGVSPDGTKMPPAAQIKDAAGAIWTILPGVGGVHGQVGAVRNGARVSSAVDFVTIKGGIVYESDFGSGSGWERWNGTGWVASSQP